MGLTSPLIPPLFCLLACAGSFVHGHRCGVILTESIKTLNVLTESKTPCADLTVADVFAAPKNTSEKETFCRAATALRRFYSQRQDGVCGGAAALPRLHSHPHVIKLLKGLDRNLCSMAHASHCPVSEAKQSTLRDFLERLKTILKEKYSKCRS
ncbi:PREDICTED: interleukin-4 isoform X1 [Propithecus coquereli]|uniref:Interleukin-4 n=1 Tax=Propithecus coquereli TaxID=379532 RepID=A0A2K6FUD4_PROCO|nr:PREDICTED: interleukin-4 isoform X1 [Propithecus coquereli]